MRGLNVIHVKVISTDAEKPLANIDEKSLFRSLALLS